MKLYMHPVSTTSRPVMQFIADNDIAADMQVVDILKGEHYEPAYSKINPNDLIPMLEDGDFRLTESAAILRYRPITGLRTIDDDLLRVDVLAKTRNAIVTEIIGDDGDALAVRTVLHRCGDDGARNGFASRVADIAEIGHAGVAVGTPALGEFIEEIAAIGECRSRNENARRELAEKGLGE